MTRALFITTETNNCDPVVDSWTVRPAGDEAASAVGGPAGDEAVRRGVRFKYWCEGHRRDGDMTLVAERLASGAHVPEGWPLPEREGRPDWRGLDVVFYIGACVAPGNPGIDTLGMIGQAAPLVHICFDGGDSPWWPVMRRYRQAGVFRLQVNIDGADCPEADMTTLCPVDPRPYDAVVDVLERDIALGFSGNLGSGLRQQIATSLMQEADLVVRPRSGLETADYADYARFMRRCRAVVNIPVSGTGQYLHVKARVVEAGLAGAAVLDHEASPSHKWFPGAIIPYRGETLVDVARGLTQAQVADAAGRLSEAVRARHMPWHFWDAVCGRAGL